MAGLLRPLIDAEEWTTGLWSFGQQVVVWRLAPAPA